MKKQMKHLLTGLFLLVLAQAAVAETLTTKIAVLDLPKILRSSPQMEATSNRLKKEFKPRQDKIVALQKSLADAQAKMKRDATVMSGKELRQLRDKMANDQRDLRRMEEDYLADARAAQKEAMNKIVAKINKLVEKVAAEGKYDLILQKEYVAFAGQNIDITPQVVDALRGNKKP